MSQVYNTYYGIQNLFGEAHPDVLRYFRDQFPKGSLLDLGCGQGRDAIPLAQMGYTVTGIDHSEVGISQMSGSAAEQGCEINAICADFFELDNIAQYDFILMDNLFHFAGEDRKNDLHLIQKFGNELGVKSRLVICIQDTGKKLETLMAAVDQLSKLKVISEQTFTYSFRDETTNHDFFTPYRMIVLRSAQ